MMLAFLIFLWLLFLAAITALGAWGVRIYFQRKIQPNEAAPNGWMYADFWTEQGGSRYRLVKVAVNGYEVEAPAGSKHPRYVFDHESVRDTLYPADFPIPALQSPIKVASWHETDPNAINPKRTTPIITPEVLGDLLDENTLTFLNSVDETYKKMELALAKAIANTLNKNVVYIVMCLTLLGVIVGDVFIIMSHGAITKLGGG